MNQTLSKISLCNEVHYRLVKMLKPKSYRELWLDGKKYAVFTGTFDGLPEEGGQIDSLIEDFETEVDNNFWNNGLKKQKQYVEHIFIAYQSAYDWHMKSEEVMILALTWCIEYSTSLHNMVDSNPGITDDPAYSMAWDSIRRVQGITGPYFRAKHLLEGCRSTAEEYLSKSFKTRLESLAETQPVQVIGLPTSTDLVPKPAEPGVKLQWKGDKTDLAELVWALAKSGRITDTTTGQPATQKEIARQMVTLVGLDSLDVIGLVKGRMNTYKATSDGKTFVAALYQLVNERAESA